MSKAPERRVPGRPASRSLRSGLLIGGAALISPLILLNLGREAGPAINDAWLTVLVCLIPPLAAAACLMRSRAATADRLAWRLIAAGIAMWSIGAIGRFLTTDPSAEWTVPSWTDIFFFAMYPLVFAGLILVLRNRLRSYRHLAVYDAVAGALVLIALAFTFLTGPISDNLKGDSDLAAVVLAVYPLADLGLIVLVATLLRFSGRLSDGPWPAFGIGLLLFALADFYFAFSTPGGGATLSLLFSVWLIGFLLMIAGSWRPDGEVREVEPGPRQLVVPVVFLTLAVVALLYGQNRDLWDSAVATHTVVIVLVVLRLALTAYEFRRKMISRELNLRDDISGLPARNQLDNWLDDLAGAPPSQRAAVSLFVIGISRLERYEAALGLLAVDTILSATATRIRRSVGSLGQLAVSERGAFALVSSESSRPEPNLIVDRILGCFDDPFTVSGIRLQLSPVVGVASSPADTSDPRDLLRLAILSRQEAERGDLRAQLSPTEPESGRARLKRLDEMFSALEHDQLRLFYQPKVRTSDGHVRSMEALVRWQHPVEGLLGPDEFVPLAEDHGLMPDLTSAVAGMASDQIGLWQEEGLDVDVAINIGIADLFDESLPERLLRPLSARELDPRHMTLEVSENFVMSQPELLANNLRRLKNSGFRLSLDDFGSGSTSLAYLRELPLDEVKIDRSLIAKMHKTPDDAILVESAISIAKRLGLAVVAEGAEEDATVERLMKVDCGEIQSYYFARPMPAEEVTHWLAALADGDARIKP